MLQSISYCARLQFVALPGTPTFTVFLARPAGADGFLVLGPEVGAAARGLAPAAGTAGAGLGSAFLTIYRGGDHMAETGGHELGVR